jgi:hypothetical protein
MTNTMLFRTNRGPKNPFLSGFLNEINEPESETVSTPYHIFVFLFSFKKWRKKVSFKEWWTKTMNIRWLKNGL